MLRAILVDDEKHVLNLLTKALDDRDDVSVIATYNDASSMLEEVAGLNPDIVFLDIEMPEINGLQLGERLRKMELETEIVYVTAYSQYALEAFNVNAIGYLLKPIDSEKLNRTINRAKKRIPTSFPPAPMLETELPLPDVRIECFGGFSIYKEGQLEPIRFPTNKSEELFAYLLMNQSSNISKWTLCDSLWPQQGNPKSNEKNLHTTVYRMKKVLRDHGIEVQLTSQRGIYRMESNVHCDYIRFKQESDTALESSDCQHEQLAELVQQYKGPLFAGMDYHWCEVERERMSRYYTGLAKKLVACYIQSGQHIKAIDKLVMMLEHVPYDSDAYETLLKIFIELQDKASFFTYYEKMEHMFHDELGLEPPNHLKHLYELMK